MEKAVDNDPTYECRNRSAHYELLVFDKIIGDSFLVETYSVNQWSWPDRIRGLIYDEILVTKNAIQVLESPGELGPALMRAREGPNILKNHAMSFLLNNDKVVRKWGIAFLIRKVLSEEKSVHCRKNLTSRSLCFEGEWSPISRT